MQYSPYSPNLNPYQTIYNNGGAAAYNPQWGYADAFAHAVGYRSSLPLGYTRQQYNEERALAAESMWKSPLLGLGSFAVGTASIYAIWGSPLEGLAEKFGGGAAYRAGFSGKPGALEIGSARSSVMGLENFKAERAAARAGRAELAAIDAQLTQAKMTVSGLESAAASKTTTWGLIGGASGLWNKVKEGAGRATSTFLKEGVGGAAGAVADFSVTGVGGLFEGVANKMTGGAFNQWTAKAGHDIVGSSFLKDWSAAGKTFKKAEAGLVSRITELTAQLGGNIAEAERAPILESIKAASAELEELRGFGGIKGILTKAKGKIGAGLRAAGRIVEKGGVSALLGAGAKSLTIGAAGVGSFFASMYLNPVTVAEMYAMEQTVGYAADMYSNYQTENEIKRNLMAKSSRILGYGYADPSRGLQGGLSEVQRNRIVSKVKDMAEIGANRGDLIGWGSNSLFGGHARYSERLKELKSILNVGMDMGFFDMSKSIDDFEKKFEQTVKTVDKLSKFLKKTKGEIMTMMANVQQTEGLYNMSDLNKSVLKKDYAARISGADITTVMQESVAGAQLARQSGFSASFGASVMSTNRIMMSNAIRAGDLTREDIFNAGGEQGVIANLQQGVLNMMNDDELLKETAMDYEYNARTGRYERTNKRINRMKNASASELRAMSRERAIMANRMSYSRIRKTMMVGGELYDRLHYAREDMKNGKLSESDMMSRVYTMAKQRQLVYYNQTGSSAQADELLAQAFMSDYGMEAPIARAMVKSINGGYENFKMQNDMAVAADRYRSGYENSGVGLWSALTSDFKANIGTHFGVAATSAIGGAVAGGGAVGAGIMGTIGFGVSVASRSLYTAGIIAASRMGLDSEGIRRGQNTIINQMTKYGYSANHVMSYLKGTSSHAEELAKLDPKAVQSAARVIMRLGAAQTADQYTQTYSNAWKTMINAAGETDSVLSDKVDRQLAYNASNGRDANNFKGMLGNASLNAGLINEFGLKDEEKRTLIENLERTKNGESVDVYNMSEGAQKAFGKIVLRAMSKAGLSEIETTDILKNLKVTKDGKSEFDVRNENRWQGYGSNSASMGAVNEWLIKTEGFESNADKKIRNAMNYVTGQSSSARNWSAAGQVVGGAGALVAIGGGLATLGVGASVTGIGTIPGLLIAGAGAAISYVGYSVLGGKSKELMDEMGADKEYLKATVSNILTEEGGDQELENLMTALDENSNMDPKLRAATINRGYERIAQKVFKQDSKILSRWNNARTSAGDNKLRDILGATIYSIGSDHIAPTISKLVREVGDKYKSGDSLTDDAAYYMMLKVGQVHGQLSGDTPEQLSKLEETFKGRSASSLIDLLKKGQREKLYDLNIDFDKLSADISKKSESEQMDALKMAFSNAVATKAYKDGTEELNVKSGNADSNIDKLTSQTAQNCLMAANILKESLRRLGYY